MPRSRLPVLAIYQRQKTHRMDLALLKRRTRRALPLCVAAAKAGDVPLKLLFEVEASIVSDDDIARIHGEFMDDPTPTDVITFQHGEILVSADTAALRGPEHGHETETELLLYLVHGLLHLAGWEDHDEAERTEMHRIQDRILAEVLAAEVR